MVAAAGLCSGPQTGHGSAFWVPKAVAQTPQGGAAPASQTTTEQMGAAKGKRRVLCYRNPMGLPDRSDVPKKDPMGMEYIPIYENEADDKTKARVSLISREHGRHAKLGCRAGGRSTGLLNRAWCRSRLLRNGCRASE